MHKYTPSETTTPLLAYLYADDSPTLTQLIYTAFINVRECHHHTTKLPDSDPKADYAHLIQYINDDYTTYYDIKKHSTGHLCRQYLTQPPLHNINFYKYAQRLQLTGDRNYLSTRTNILIELCNDIYKTLCALPETHELRNYSATSKRGMPPECATLFIYILFILSAFDIDPSDNNPYYVEPENEYSFILQTAYASFYLKHQPYASI